MISTPRAMSAEELTRQRLGNQASRAQVLVDVAPVLWQAQINETFTSYERIISLTYNNGSGDRTLVLPDHTLYVGSVAGAWDIAILRVRATPGTSNIQIGEISNVLFASGQHLTAVDDFQLWAKPRTANISDSNIEYDGQHAAFAPVAVIDPDMVFFDEGSPLSITFSAAKSWCLAAGAKTYAWSFPGANSSSSTTTNAPTATYNAPGRYRFACTVTVGGKSTTKYGYIHFVGDAYNPFVDVEIKSASGTDNDGYEFEFDTWDARAYQPYARAYLVSRDYYAGVEQYLGYNNNHVHVKIAGRLVRDELSSKPNQTGAVTMRAVSPAWLLGKIDNSGRMYKNSTTTPANWNEYEDMTPDQCLFDVARWQSTITTCLNVFRCEDTHIHPTFAIGEDNLIDQLREIGKRVRAEPRFDAFGDLYFMIPQTMIPEDERDALPIFLTLTDEDWHEETEVEINMPEASQLLVTGINVLTTNGKKKYFYSIAGGRTLDRFGTAGSPLEMLVADQDEANEKAALALAAENPFFDAVIHLAANNWMVSPAYPGYISGTVRHNGQTIYSGRMILREVEAIIENGAMLMDWHCIPETIPGPAVKGDTPYSPDPPRPIIPGGPTGPIPGEDPPGPDPDPGTLPTSLVFLSQVGVIYCVNFNSEDEDPVFATMNSGLDEYTLNEIGSGNLFTTIQGSSWLRLGYSIFYTPAPGETWIEIINKDWLDENNDGQLRGLGVNYYSGVAIFITTSRHVFIGNQNGFDRRSQQPETANFYNDITYAAGSWRWPIRTPSGPKLVFFDAGGDFSSADELGFSVIDNLGPGGTKYIYCTSVGGNILSRISDNDASTLILLDDGPYLDAGDTYRIGVYSDGSLLLATDGDTNPLISTDFGATWGAVPNLTLGEYQFAVVDMITWLAFKRNPSDRLVLYVTTDSGNTWIERSGNLTLTYSPKNARKISWWA